MKVAVVILNWNGKKLLEKFLPSVIGESGSAKIYIADNGSTDDSIEWLEDHYPDIALLKNDQNLGFAEGYNKALMSIESDYYVLLNSDVEVSNNWIDPVIKHMDENPEVAACQPRILSYIHKDSFEHAGAAGGFIDKFGYPFCRGRILDTIEKDYNQYSTNSEIFWASGACMFIRSDIWKELGGFDSDFFAHMEEIDLCWRINARKYKIKYIPQSTVFHLGGGTLTYDSPAKLYYNFRNNLFMLHKNLPQGKHRSIIFKRLLLDGIAGIRFILTLKCNAFWQVLRSHLSYYRHIKTLNRKRREIINDNHYYPDKLILNKSMVFEYYLRKKKKFTDIWKEG